MENHWIKEWEKAEMDKMKNLFKIGWLTSCLKGEGWSDEQVEAELEKAEVAANRTYTESVFKQIK